MSNHRNYRRDEEKRTEHGPRWENHNPGKGCNSTHVARARRKWKRRANRTSRRNGIISHKVVFMKKKHKHNLPKEIIRDFECWVTDSYDTTEPHQEGVIAVHTTIEGKGEVGRLIEKDKKRRK